MAWAWFEFAEGVDVIGGDDIGESGAFFVGESGVSTVGGGACEVDFLVCDIEVAAEEDGFVHFELVEE